MKATGPSLLCASLLALSASPAGAFNEFYTGGLAAHSTFHYELVRTLAYAAGFDATSAERIAVTSEAVDLGDFQGYDGTRVTVSGTSRLSTTAGYWHSARRGCSDSSGRLAYPSPDRPCANCAPQCDTCAYFTTQQLCPAGGPELTSIDRWALWGAGSLSAPTPQYALNGGGAAEVPARSIYALGIYLHSLADSYSHEACMDVAQTRAHQSAPPECNGLTWHGAAEYGGGDGVGGTIAAARTVLRAAQLYLGAASPRCPMDDWITQWAQTAGNGARAQMASAKYAALQQGVCAAPPLKARLVTARR